MVTTICGKFDLSYSEHEFNNAPEYFMQKGKTTTTLPYHAKDPS